MKNIMMGVRRGVCFSKFSGDKITGSTGPNAPHRRVGQKLLLRAAVVGGLAIGMNGAGWSESPLRIVATTPDVADITRRIGGDRVDVESMARGSEDIHQITMRPSFVTRLNRADAVVFLGMTIEHSFLPALLEVAANPKLRWDPVSQCVGPGCIDCSRGLKVLGQPTTLSRAEGELHPMGNPHYNLGPDQGLLIAKNIATKLSAIDPAHRSLYEANLQSYLTLLEAKLAEWRRWVVPLKGLKAVSYHQDVAYLAHFTGIDFIDTIELKPGIPPTPTHIASLVNAMKAQHVGLIVREQQFEAKTPEWLAQQTGAKIAVIGVMANALPGADTFIKLSEENIKALLRAVGKEAS